MKEIGWVTGADRDTVLMVIDYATGADRDTGIMMMDRITVGIQR